MALVQRVGQNNDENSCKEDCKWSEKPVIHKETQLLSSLLYNLIQQEQKPPLYGHYTGQLVSAGTSS